MLRKGLKHLKERLEFFNMLNLSCGSVLHLKESLGAEQNIHDRIYALRALVEFQALK